MAQTKFSISPKRLYCSLILTIITVTTAIPAIANSNFGKVEFSPEDKERRLTGYTKGVFPLHTMGKRDRNGNPCTGFATPTPDHIIVLPKDFLSLQLKVDSGGDTTLFIQGPNDRTIRCGDDTGKNKDASITDKPWKAGEYKVWVGTFKENEQRNYSLYITK